MATLSRFPRLRPGLPSFLRLSLLGPILVSASAMHAQAPCVVLNDTGQRLSTILAGQGCTYSVPTSGNPPTYSGFVTDSFGPVPVLYEQGTNTYLTLPLMSGEYSLEYTILSGNGDDSRVITSFPVFQADGNSPRSLIGQYSFQLSGKTAAAGRAGLGLVAAAGSFTADGSGIIRAGVVDINSPAGIVTGEAVTGTYRVNAYGLGVVNLTGSQGELQLTFESAPLNASVTQYPIASNGFGEFQVSFPIVSGGTVAATVGGLISASGTFVQIAVPDILTPGFGQQFPFSQLSQPATLNGTFFANLSGQQTAGAARLQFAAAGTVTADIMVASNGTLTNLSGWTGTYTPVDLTTGRSVLTLSYPAQLNAPKQVFSLYETRNGVTLYLTSIAPEQSTGLLSGRADQY